MVSKLIKYIESDSKLDIQENYIYDINLNCYKVKDTCKNRAFASLFKSTSGNIVYYHIYNNPTIYHILKERSNRSDIICIRLRVDSYFNAKVLNNKYTSYNKAIITVSN